MSLIIRKKQGGKQWRQQVVVITVHKFSYLKHVDLIDSKLFNLEIREQNLLYNLNW